MLVLVTYDVSTTTDAGKRRLSKVAKTCQNYGQRVQNSVFECVVDSTQFKRLQLELGKLIDETTDSLRYYNLGEKYKQKVQHIGAKASYDVEGTLFL